jgi:hypothetical protein
MCSQRFLRGLGGGVYPLRAVRFLLIHLRKIGELHVPHAVEFQEPAANLVADSLRLLVGLDIDFHLEE